MKTDTELTGNQARMMLDIDYKTLRVWTQQGRITKPYTFAKVQLLKETFTELFCEKCGARWVRKKATPATHCVKCRNKL